MAFTIYRSTDSGAPTINGLTGSLLTTLDACLVDGYGAMPAAGWSKPLPNTSSYGMYLQGSGSVSCSFFLYDAGSGSAVGAEAQLSGWESITSIEGGRVTGSNQFPVVAQMSPGSGSVTVRKSAVAQLTARSWIIFADSKTVYGFISNGDAATSYHGFAFGDYYSLQSGSVDNTRVMIMGRNAASSSTVTVDRMDTLGASLVTGVTGCYTPHLFSGYGTSSLIGKHGDGVKGSTTGLLGSVPFLNAPNNGIYLGPVWITDSISGYIKGRFRGLYQFCHPITNVIDGQMFSGSGDFAGKTFYVVKQSMNAGVYLIETTDTLETNIP